VAVFGSRDQIELLGDDVRPRRPTPMGLVQIGVYSGWEISATTVRPSTPA
jgi:hypothetical protein